MTHACVYVDLTDRRITLVRFPDPAESESVLEGQVYETVACVEDMLCDVLDMDYSDASGVVMAAEMQHRDWVLETIEPEWFVTLRRVPELAGQLPRRADFDGADAPLLEWIQRARMERANERRQ